jgi:hypothetical protein
MPLEREGCIRSGLEQHDAIALHLNEKRRPGVRRLDRGPLILPTFCTLRPFAAVGEHNQARKVQPQHCLGAGIESLDAKPEAASCLDD